MEIILCRILVIEDLRSQTGPEKYPVLGTSGSHLYA